MANVSGLKRTGKGEPPARSQAPRNVTNPPRDKAIDVAPEPAPAPPTPPRVEKGAVQLSVPVEVANAFAKAAGERHGFKKGSKSLFFEELVAAYHDGKVQLD